MYALINNAGVSPKAQNGAPQTSLTTLIETWMSVFHLTLVAPILLAQGFFWRAKSRGRIDCQRDLNRRLAGAPVCWQRLYDFEGGARRLHQAGSRLRADPRAPVTNTIMRQGVPTIINPYDLFALEAALELRDRFGGEITVLTIGPMSSEDSLRKALTFGADRAILLSDRCFACSDTLVTTYAFGSRHPKSW